MTALRDSLTRSPVAHDPARGEQVIETLDPALARGAMGELLTGAAGSSPYLARLISRHADWLRDAAAMPADDILRALLTELDSFCASASTHNEVATNLRRAKSRAALLAALADLGGAWALEDVTGALTEMADASVEHASRWLLQQELARERLPGLGEDALEHGAGYVVLAMGKMGAGELNYSSDIDLIALFDDSLFDGPDVAEARARYIHVTKQLVKLLSENTSEGYAFRTDLRLRPAPSTTPVCVSMTAAERYYETAGRTWERAAHIKARPLVDRKSGEQYLAGLSPFIWRRHLDFAAIEDVHSMLRKIRAQRARFTPEGLTGYDLKLGPGGIREIEFFAQTRQLIVGGRDPALRLPTTLGALKALSAAGWIAEETRASLSEDYVRLRTVEHRLQMIEDAQTHAVPKSAEARARVAALDGVADLADFEGALATLLGRVHDSCEDFFVAGGAATGEQATPVNESSFASAGFDRPSDAARIVARWHAGEIAATRSERAQSLLIGLESQILERLSGANDADRALVQFDRFLSGLPAGVQVFSLFAANPQLLDLIVEICSAAPRLSAYLARHAQTLDALLDQDFWQPLPDRQVLDADLRMHLDGITDYERALDEARRWAREQWFRVGVHVLRTIASPVEAGAGFSRIAETYIARLLPRVIDDFATRHGPPPGNGLAVLAMGKLGSGEMTAGSDLDLITIFDDAGVEMSDGPKPLAPGIYYRRLTQALVLALTAPTAEGALYEVDMRLRPSGGSGPVAVSLASFERYQKEEAWVWEHLALTRARPVAGPAELCAQVARIAGEALTIRAGSEAVMTEAREMRTRLMDAHGADRPNPWALKHAAGGLMEIEFLAQVGTLLHGLPGAARTNDAIAALEQTGWLSGEDVQTLSESARLLQSLQHVERVALDSALDPDGIGHELRQVLIRATGSQSFADLTERLNKVTEQAARIVSSRLDGIPDPY